MGKIKLVVLMRMLQRRIALILVALVDKQESSPNVVTVILQVFSIDVYALPRGATLSSVTPLIARKFDVLPIS